MMMLIIIEIKPRHAFFPALLVRGSCSICRNQREPKLSRHMQFLGIETKQGAYKQVLQLIIQVASTLPDIFFYGLGGYLHLIKKRKDSQTRRHCSFARLEGTLKANTKTTLTVKILFQKLRTTCFVESNDLVSEKIAPEGPHTSSTIQIARPGARSGDNECAITALYSFR